MLKDAKSAKKLGKHLHAGRAHVKAVEFKFLERNAKHQIDSYPSGQFDKNEWDWISMNDYLDNHSSNMMEQYADYLEAPYENSFGYDSSGYMYEDWGMSYDFEDMYILDSGHHDDHHCDAVSDHPEDICI